MRNPNSSPNAHGLKERFNDGIAKDPWDFLGRTPIMPDNNMMDRDGNIRSRIEQELDDWVFDIQDEDLDDIVGPELRKFSDEDLLACREAFDESYEAGCQSVYDLVSSEIGIENRPRMIISSQRDMRNRYRVSENTNGFYSQEGNFIAISDFLSEDTAVDTVAHELWHCRQYEISESARGGNDDQMWTLYRYNYIKYKNPDGPDCDYSDYRYQILEAEAFKFGHGIVDRYRQAVAKELARNREEIFQKVGATYQERRVMYGLLSGDYEVSRSGDPQLSAKDRRAFVDLVSDFDFDQDQFIHDYLDYIPNQLADHVEGVDGVWSFINGPQKRNGENRSDELRYDELTLVGFMNGDFGPEQVSQEYLATIKKHYPNLIDFRASVNKRLGQLSRLGIDEEKLHRLMKARGELEEDIYYHQKRYERIIEDLCDKANDCAEESALRTPIWMR